MFIIEPFVEEAPPGKSPWTKENVFSLIRFLNLGKITKIKICHMVATEHPEVIEGRQRLISVDVIDYEEADEDDSIDKYGAASDEEDGSGLVGVGVTEEVEDMQKALKYSSLLYYMLKPSHLTTQGFYNNRTSQEKLFNTHL